MPRGEMALRLKRVAQKGGDAGASGLHGLMQNVDGLQAQNLFRGRIEPTYDGVFIRRHDTRWDAFEERLGERFLHRDLFVEECVFQHGGDVFGQQHQILEILVIETLAREPMTEKEPADNAPARVQRDDDFRAEGIKRATQQGTLCLLGLSEMAPANQMGVELKPAHQRIALAVFHLRGFRETAQAGTQAIMLALPHPRKESDAGHAGGIGHSFHHRGE